MNEKKVLIEKYECANTSFHLFVVDLNKFILALVENKFVWIGLYCCFRGSVVVFANWSIQAS